MALAGSVRKGTLQSLHNVHSRFQKTPLRPDQALPANCSASGLYSQCELHVSFPSTETAQNIIGDNP